MRVAAVIFSFTLPLLALAQASGNQTLSPAPTSAPSGAPSPPASPRVSLSTSITTGVSLGPGRSMVSYTSTIVNTITASEPSPTGNTSNSNTNNTASNNGSNSNKTSSTPTGPLPTAPTDVNGGGNGPGGAPNPGSSSPLGIFGPDDSFTNWVVGRHVNKMLLVVAGAMVGGMLVLA